jgi:archaellum component FlaC
MVEENVDLGFIAKLMQKNNDEFRMLRKEVADMRWLCVRTYESMGRMERDRSELRDDVELMLKMECGGTSAHLQTCLENVSGRMDEKIDELAKKVDLVSTQLGGVSDQMVQFSSDLTALASRI